MEKIAAYHELNYKKKVEVMTQVPGVVTLMGAFSDFCNGYCIAGTGALGLRVALSTREDNTVRLYDATKGDKKHFTLTNLKYKKEDRWANYVKGVLYSLSEEGFLPQKGLDITLKGALLYCDQITVAESVIVGFLLAIDRYLNLRLAKGTIIQLAYKVGTIYCGIHVRLRDLITLMHAKPGNIFYFDLQSMSYEVIEYPFNNIEGAYGLILDPSLPPQLLREELEEKRVDANICCEELKKHLPPDYQLRNYPIKDLKSHVIRELDEHTRHTCEYVIFETNCAKKAYTALVEKDAKLFGRCLNDIYIGMRDVFDITCPEVDWLARRAGETDRIYGTSYVSNGASSSIFMILEKEGEEAYKKCMEDYRRIFDFQPRSRLFCPGGEARVLEEF